ncbi:MAG TPA: GNAT family N-acetyltransferase [Lachnospiraceae bacterium]|nr:GNAT family N-acetyltransferase [Lachnospiraceae bacterium]
MEIIIKEFKNRDLDFVKRINFLFYLKIRYQEEYCNENVFTAMNDKGETVGVGSLSFDESWYGLDLDSMHKLKFDIAVEEDSEFAVLVTSKLIDRFICKYRDYQKKYPNKKMCICGWCNSDQIDNIQFLLEKGFQMNHVWPVLKYDLSKKIRHYEIPINIKIKKYPICENNTESYQIATAIANNGIQDNTGKLCFQTEGESFRVYAAMDGKKVVGAVTIWDMAEGRSATENIFIDPEYRGKSIAKEVVATGLEFLKEAGQKIATLSMSGTNLKAMKVYLSMGYELMYTTIEMQLHV